ncbi:hypothetical protein [Mesonia aquimarina]|uniref:hypothetical protein n=1 Tax=Mesonia aquimarina TaxID=1504967 RepID=UPI000EF5D5F1|nr:hypothetical protein [Mesonia aquimarina]
MKTFLSFLCLLFFINGISQEISVDFIDKYPFKKERFIGVDKFDNYYFIDKNIFFKVESGTQKMYQFSDIQLGKLTSVDLLNPLKITLFYRDLNTVVILDNRLNEIKRINFNTIAEFRNVGFATTANDRSLWIFNLDLQQLELFDYNRNVQLSKTQPIAQEVLQQKSNFNFCWLLTEKNLQQFNSYGSLINDFPKNGISAIVQDNKVLISLNNNQLSVLTQNTNSFKPISISEIEVKDFYLANENLYIYNGKYVFHYVLNLPK